MEPIALVPLEGAPFRASRFSIPLKLASVHQRDVSIYRRAQAIPRGCMRWQYASTPRLPHVCFASTFDYSRAPFASHVCSQGSRSSLRPSYNGSRLPAQVPAPAKNWTRRVRCYTVLRILFYRHYIYRCSVANVSAFLTFRLARLECSVLRRMGVCHGCSFYTRGRCVRGKLDGQI